MRIIPVIDLKNGHVVHAVRGNRAAYQPINSPLCPSSSPFNVVTSLIEASRSMTLYIADLDAIDAESDNYSIVLELAEKFNFLELWVDAGFKTALQIDHWNKIPNLRPVIGTESHKSMESLLCLLDIDVILSLDFRDNQLLGAQEILNHTHYWPENVIVMSLNTVGSAAGPAFSLLDRMKKLKPDTNILAAGGVRNQSDLTILESQGITGALIASALHNKTISL